MAGTKLMLLIGVLAIFTVGSKGTHSLGKKHTCTLKVGEDVFARWTNNKYYAGKVASISETKHSIDIVFNDEDEITHPMKDTTAIFLDKVPANVTYKHHVIASWQGSYTKYTGFVIDVNEWLMRGFKVRFDDNDEAWYAETELRIFPNTKSKCEVGARVFARWTNGLYYRGFVSKSDLSTITIKYDDGDKITLLKTDLDAVILDKIPDTVTIGQKVIGYWPGSLKYYPGVVSTRCDGNTKYFVKFDDGDVRCEALHEIRLLRDATVKC